MDAQTRLPELNLHLNGCSILSSLAHTRTTLITFQHVACRPDGGWEEVGALAG